MVIVLFAHSALHWLTEIWLPTHVTLSNNLAYEGMSVLIGGIPKSPLDTGSAGLDGISASAGQLTTEVTCDVTLGWDFVNLWSFGNGEYTLPILRGIPSGVQPTVLPDYL